MRKIYIDKILYPGPSLRLHRPAPGLQLPPTGLQRLQHPPSDHLHRLPPHQGHQARRDQAHHLHLPAHRDQAGQEGVRGPRQDLRVRGC